MTVREQIRAALAGFPNGATAVELAAVIGKPRAHLTGIISKCRYYGDIEAAGYRVGERKRKHVVYRLPEVDNAHH